MYNWNDSNWNENKFNFEQVHNDAGLSTNGKISQLKNFEIFFENLKVLEILKNPKFDKNVL